jgi:hypothetical protein
MERLQSPPALAAAESVPELPLPPNLEIRTLPLLRRLDALREPDVTQPEVDQFLRGLSAILPEQESPRERADLMLDVLEDSRLCELTGSDGTQVGATALEVLLALGYPYALEVTPTMLARVRDSAPTTIPRSVFVGVGVAGVSALFYLSGFLSQYLSYLSLSEGPTPYSWQGVPGRPAFDDAVTQLPLLFTLLLAPATLTALTWSLKWRGPRLLFNALQWGLGAAGLWLGLTGGLFDLYVQDSHQGSLLLLGTMTLVSALCLRPRASPPPSPEPRPSG